MNLAYRWFIGYGFLEKTPHFSTLSYNFKHRFSSEVFENIFTWVLEEAIASGFLHISVAFSGFVYFTKMLHDKDNLMSCQFHLAFYNSINRLHNIITNFVIDMSLRDIVYPYIKLWFIISITEFRILFIFPTQAIWSEAFSCSVIPCLSASCFTNREKISSACRSISVR